MRLAFRGVITAGCILWRASGFLRPPPCNKTKPTCASPAAAMASTDGEAPSRHHPSALRNRGFIAAELGKWLGGSIHDAPHLLEVASGTGCHVEAFAHHLPACWTYQPTEYDQTRIPDILATIKEGKHSNIHPPVVLDVCSDPSTWPRPAGGETAEGASGRQWDAVVCSNLIHISPQECTGSLLGGAAAGLKVGGYLFVYGPFALNGLLIPDSNKNFDASLKARSGGSWGIRDAAWVCGLAYDQGLELTAMTLMPANNFFVVFTKVREAATMVDVEDRKARVAELVAAVVMPAREALVAKVSAK
ncbi:unnamed protein product [Ectocarpus sp. 12 AP-2014]